MASSDRWQSGDVILWFETGTHQGAKTDSDVYLRFYDDKDTLLAWVEAYERVDLKGFEEGEVNCGYLGNLHRQPWLQALLDDGVKLGLRIENVTDDKPEWFVEQISLDFRVGPLADSSSSRTWKVSEWITPLESEKFYMAVELATDQSFEDIGFEHELEIQSGGPGDSPR